MILSIYYNKLYWLRLWSDYCLPLLLQKQNAHVPKRKTTAPGLLKKLTINPSLYEQSQPLPNRSYFVLGAIYPSGRTKIFANVEVTDFQQMLKES